MRAMAGAFGWGLLAASSLLIGALIALRFTVDVRLIGLIMAFGSGVLISAVAFDLVEDASEQSTGQGALISGLLVPAPSAPVSDAITTSSTK